MTPDLEFDADALPSFELDRYGHIDLNRLAVFAISYMQEHAIPVTFEYVVVTVYRMFPAKFALEGFPNYPDATRVNRALLQLRPKYRGWATGDVQHGFVLTETGTQVVEQTRRLLDNPDLAAAAHKRVSPKAPRTMLPAAELLEVERSRLYEKWKKGSSDEVDRYAIWELLQAYPYTPKEYLRDRLAHLRSQAHNLKRQDLVQFFEWVRKEYQAQLGGGESG